MRITQGTITLRTPEERDIPFILDHTLDINVLALAQPAPPQPVMRSVIEQRFAAGASSVTTSGPDDIEFAITLADDPADQAVGVAGLYGFSAESGNAELGLVINTAAARNQGHGRDVMLALALYAFQIRRLERLWGAIKSSNGHALRLLAGLGVEREGVLRKHRWSNGQFVDLELFGLLREDWLPRYGELTDAVTDDP